MCKCSIIAVYWSVLCPSPLLCYIHQMRAAELLWEDERKRYGEVTDKYAADIETYKNEIRELTEESKENAILGSAISKKNELEEQVKSLSQQLLRKQSSVQELLAERSALKVRVQDLTTRSDYTQHAIRMHITRCVYMVLP